MLRVEEEEGCWEIPALGLPWPKDWDSAARESEVTVPTASGMRLAARGSLVTLILCQWR